MRWKCLQMPSEKKKDEKEWSAYLEEEERKVEEREGDSEDRQREFPDSVHPHP